MPLINIADQEIHFLEKGSGEALLIFHDNLHSSQAYTRELEYFSDRYHVLAYDFPGRGKSTRDVLYRDELEYDPWNFRADFACHLLMELGIDRCIVMGEGEGAWAALHFAGKQARLHKITPLAAIGDSFLPEMDSRALHRALDIREHYYVRNAQSLEEQHGKDWREVVDADTAHLRQIADRGGYRVHDFVMNSIPCPVLLTGTLKDVTTPGIAGQYARIASIIPDCSIVLAGESGHRYAEEHPWMWTDPEAFRKAVDHFLTAVKGQ